MKKTRVIVVDDSALVRSLLSEIINRQRDMECIGTANDPLIAREMIRDRPAGASSPVSATGSSASTLCSTAGRSGAENGLRPESM